MTTLMRWTPLFSSRRDLTGFDHLFGNLLTGPNGGAAKALFAPSADIHETPEAFVIRLDLPGISQKDVKVTIQDDTLAIRGERKHEESQTQGLTHYRERRFGSFERTFTLTAPVRADQVKATYRDGVLEVRVPKAEEARTREIEVQIG